MDSHLALSDTDMDESDVKVYVAYAVDFSLINKHVLLAATEGPFGPFLAPSIFSLYWVIFKLLLSFKRYLSAAHFNCFRVPSRAYLINYNLRYSITK